MLDESVSGSGTATTLISPQFLNGQTEIGTLPLRSIRVRTRFCQGCHRVIGRCFFGLSEAVWFRDCCIKPIKVLFEGYESLVDCGRAASFRSSVR